MLISKFRLRSMHTIPLVLGFLSLAILGIIGCSQQDPLSVATEPVSQVNTTVQLEDLGDYYLYQDDMLLDKNDPVHQKIISEKQNGISVGNGAKTGSCSYTATPTWPSGVIPFYFSGSWTAADKQIAYNSMNAWANVSNICFVELSAGGSYILKMEKIADDANSCIAGSSTLGYVTNPKISLKASWIKTDVVIHEIGHTLCFEHEHQRPDRGNNIIIKWDNIKPNYQSYYQVFSTAPQYHTNFDVASIMHYKSMTTCPLLAYDITKPVITKADGSIINNLILSSGDITGVQNKYGNNRQTKFSVAYRSSTADEPAVWDWSRSDFINKVNSMSSNGYRLKRMEVTVINNADHYYAVFYKSTSSEPWVMGYARQDFINYYNARKAEGYRLNLMCTYSINGTDYYSATFRQSTAEETWVLGYTRSDFITKYNQLNSQGWRVNQFDVYLASDKTERYGAFFRKSTQNEPWALGYAQSDMIAYIKSQNTSGNRLNQMSVFNVNGNLVYSAFFRPGTSTESSYLGLKRNGFEYLNNKMYSEGKRLHVTGATYD